MVLRESTTQLRENTNQRKNPISVQPDEPMSLLKLLQKHDDSKAAASPGSILGNS